MIKKEKVPQYWTTYTNMYDKEVEIILTNIADWLYNITIDGKHSFTIDQEALEALCALYNARALKGDE